MLHINQVIEMSQNFVRSMKIDNGPLPVDIIGLVDRFGIPVIYDDFGEGFDALLSIRQYRYPIIVANSNKPIFRKRFSLAHELAHYLIPWHYWEKVCLERKPNYSGWEYQLEKEANIFAGEILMPYEIFYKDLLDGASEQVLSNKFLVSIPAIKRRIITIDKYYLENNYGI